jgi:hypothetical protein
MQTALFSKTSEDIPLLDRATRAVEVHPAFRRIELSGECINIVLSTTTEDVQAEILTLLLMDDMTTGEVQLESAVRSIIVTDPEANTETETLLPHASRHHLSLLRTDIQEIYPLYRAYINDFHTNGGPVRAPLTRNEFIEFWCRMDEARRVDLRERFTKGYKPYNPGEHPEGE